MGGIQSLVAREAGYSVAAECLRVQASAEADDPSLRSSDRVTLHDDAWPWYQGALGEMHVGRLLASLGPEWKVLHSVPIGAKDSDVDHILVGPNGVFVLNTKHHASASVWVGDVVLMINGEKTYHLRNARSENNKVAQRLATRVGFPVAVQSAIVTVGERSIKDIRSHDDRPISVMSSMHLVRWLTSQQATHSPTQLEILALAAEEPETWHVDPHRAENFRVMQRFSRLQDAVELPEAPTPAARHTPARTRVPAASGARSSTAPRGRTSATAGRARSKRADVTAKKLAEAIVAAAFLAVMFTMMNNGTWAPFVTGLVLMLSPTP